MQHIEINFDGLIGPSHNYAGLSFGNLASLDNADGASSPRAAALQGLHKMKTLMDLGLAQAFLTPQARPATEWLRRLGFEGAPAHVVATAWRLDPQLFRAAISASPMWAANAATVSPATDSADRRCHITVANLATMPHRSLEPQATGLLLRTIFRDPRHFAVHDPIPACFGDEGAANHMRLESARDGSALEIFVFGETERGFPARQDVRASRSVARLHRLRADRVHFAKQSDVAIQAGAFHNDVVAVSNGHVLICHEQAFADKCSLFDAIGATVPDACIVEVPSREISLKDAVDSYLFNSQLVTLPDKSMALIVPGECQSNERVRRWLDKLVARGLPISKVVVVDVRQSMRNGGGPACLRLRIQAGQEAVESIDQRFMLDEQKWNQLVGIVDAHWPERVALADLEHPDFWQAAFRARELLMTNVAPDLLDLERKFLDG